MLSCSFSPSLQSTVNAISIEVGWIDVIGTEITPFAMDFSIDHAGARIDQLPIGQALPAELMTAKLAFASVSLSPLSRECTIRTSHMETAVLLLDSHTAVLAWTGFGILSQIFLSLCIARVSVLLPTIKLFA